MNVDFNQLFVLREEIFAHNAAVRSICYSSTNDLISGGADMMVNVFSSQRDSTAKTQQIADHEKTVTALTPLPLDAVDDCPTGGFVTGSQDTAIRVYNSEGTLVRQLLGHENGVISLSFLPDARYLISGSWDGTARVWDLKDESKCIAILQGHENGVCVLGLSDGNIATGSTGKQENNQVVDFKVRIWEATSPSDWSILTEYNDHSGPVRSLAATPTGFMSTSNDGSIRIRATSGETVAVVQHPQSGMAESFVYGGASLISTGVQEYVSCSEDCSAAVWCADGSRIQLLEHPDSVWCICALPSGDIATGCNDGVIRLFTRESARMAPENIRQAFTQNIEEAKAKKRGGPSADEIAKLPGWNDRLMSSGRREGDVKVFNKNGVAVAAQWSAVSADWIEVGEVTGSRDSGMIDGVPFDHVLPVEFEQPGLGMVKLKIGYNNGENPYTTAHEFIAKHELDPAFLEQIAEYIRKNAGGSAPTIGETGPSSAASHSSAVSPPGNVTYKVFGKAREHVDKIEAKILEFSDDLSNGGLTASEKLVLKNLVSTLTATSRWHASNVSRQELGILLKLSVEWPIEKVFPVMDLLRIVALHPSGANALRDSSMFTASLPMNIGRATADDCPVALQFLTLSIVSGETPATLLRTSKSLIVSNTKNVRCAAANLLYNFAVALADQNSELSSSRVFEMTELFAAVGSAVSLAGGPNSDEETLTVAILAAKVALEATGHRDLLRGAMSPNDLKALAESTPASDSPWQNKRIEASRSLHAIIS